MPCVVEAKVTDVSNDGALPLDYAIIAMGIG